MVLDVKMMTWAGQNGLDTAKLKAAKVPIYGKWYFPELPAEEPLVNLETGQRTSFPESLLAGEVLWVSERALRRAGLSPFPDGPEEVEEHASDESAVPAIELEPLLLMARSPYDQVRSIGDGHLSRRSDHEWPVALDVDRHDPASIHLPMASIAPLLLAFGIAIAIVGIITHVVVLLVGLVWVVLGAVGWIRVGLEESRVPVAHAEH